MGTTGTVARRWRNSYDAGVPESVEPIGTDTLLAILRRHAATAPHHPAVRFMGRTLTYAALDREIQRVAAGFAGLGVRAGDRVALVLPNCPQFLIAEFAAWWLGAIVCPVNPTYPDDELTHMLARTGATIAVGFGPAYTALKRVQAQTALRTVIATNIKTYFPFWLRLGFTLTREARDGHRISLAPGDHHFERLGRRLRPPPITPVTLDQPAMMLPSGGTTGVPKAVMGAHRRLIASGRQLEAWLASVLEPGRDEILNPLPLFHVYSAVGVQSLVFLGGRTLTLVPNPRDISQVINAIDRTRPTLFCGVPTLFQAILAHQRLQTRKVDFSSIRLSFSGAAALMTETRRKWAELTGGAIVEGYSLTEAQMAAIVQPIQGRQAEGEIGLPLPDVDVMLVDPEHGVTPVAGGGEGELVIAAPQLMLGYYDQPAETADALRTHPDGRRWLYTGDLAVMDAEGYLRLVGRKKDLIKVSGFQVWPTEIEQVLSACPGVREVGVAGLPDPKRGEIAGAWVVRQEGARVSADDLKSYCRQHLAPYKVPGEIRFVSMLPKTTVGKVLRHALPGLASQA